MSAGEGFVKMIKPLGAALFLIIAVLVTAICFTSGRDPIPGYEAPEDTAFYAEHPEALKAELDAKVLPKIDGALGCEAAGGVVRVRLSAERFAVARSAILQYFDKSLFEFVSDE